MFKVNNRNTRTRCEICSELTIKTPAVRCLISVAFGGEVLIRGKHSFEDGAYLDLSVVYRENKVKETWELESKEIFSRYYEGSRKTIQHSSVNINFSKNVKKKKSWKVEMRWKKLNIKKNYFLILTFRETVNWQDITH